MSTRRSRNGTLVSPIESQSPITKAVLLVASAARYSRTWRTVDDWATIISSVFDLDSTRAKGLLTGKSVYEALSKDAAVKGTLDVDEKGMNGTGIFHKVHRPRTKNASRLTIRCLYLAPRGEEIPEYGDGVLWYEHIKSLDDSSLVKLRSDGDGSDIETGRTELVEHLVPTKEAAKKPAPTPLKDYSATSNAITPIVGSTSNSRTSEATPRNDDNDGAGDQKPAAIAETNHGRGTKRKHEDYLLNLAPRKRANLSSLFQPGTQVSSKLLSQKIATWTYDHSGDGNIPSDVLIQIATECSQVPETTTPTNCQSSNMNWQYEKKDDTPAYRRILQLRMKKIREQLHVAADGNLAMAFDIANNLASNLKHSIRSDTELREALATVDAQSNDDYRLDRIIVENVKEYLAHEAHGSKGGRRSQEIQHMLDSILCAVSSSSTSQDKISCRKLAEKLGIDNPKRAYKGRRDRDEVMESEDAHKFCHARTQKERSDRISYYAKMAVEGYVHDPNVTQPDSHDSRPRTVKLPNGKTEKHPKRNWIQQLGRLERYEHFKTSTHYHTFVNAVVVDKGDYYNEEKPPTISEWVFRHFLCPCLCNPTEASCVDITRDQTELYLKAMEAYTYNNRDSLENATNACLCIECTAEEDIRKADWTDVFRRQDANSFNRIAKTCLCPRIECNDLTLDNDPEPFKMYPWKCGKGLCSECGVAKRLPWGCPVFMENDDEIEVRRWKKQECSTGGEQMEIVVEDMLVKDVMKELRTELVSCIDHETGKTWKNRMRAIDVHTFCKNTLLCMTDFSAMMDLRPIKTKCSHVDRHVVVGIFYIFTNPRLVVTESGQVVRVTDCDIWHIFGDTLNKNTKNDHVFHNAAFSHILKHYIDKGLPIEFVRLWTDNCPTQYRCRQNFFALSKIPIDFENIKLAEHSFAQVYSFKGPWDAAGKVVKAYIRMLEETERERVKHAFDCFLLALKYFRDNLPDGNDWIKIEEEKSDKLLLKTPYSAVTRHACYATEDADEYNRLKGEHNNIIFIDRQASQDTTTYDTCNTGSHFSADGTETADGIQLKMKNEICRCNKCREGQGGECNNKHITGQETTWCKKSLQEIAVEKAAKQKEAIRRDIATIEPILPSLLPLSGHNTSVLTAILRVMDIKATRQDGKSGNPLKKDLVSALQGQTAESIAQRLATLRTELTSTES